MYIKYIILFFKYKEHNKITQMVNEASTLKVIKKSYILTFYLHDISKLLKEFQIYRKISCPYLNHDI